MKRSSAVCGLFLQALGILTSGPPETKPRDEGKVTIEVTDNYGHPLQDYARIRLSGGGLTINTSGHEVLRLKYGRYTVTADVSGFRTSQQVIVINQPEQTFSVAMPLGTIEGDPKLVSCSLYGRVVPERADLRVRLVSLFGATLVDVPVKKDGSFEFQDIECGKYLLMAIGQTGCLGLQFPTITKRPMHIRMPISTGPGGCTSTPIRSSTDSPQ